MLLRDEAATHAAGAALADVLRAGDIVALEGDLGAGKTTLARGLLAALGLAGEAPSPTFAIVQAYAPPEVRLAVWHVDLYRLDDAAQTAELGLDEALEEGALVVEWPDRLDAGLLRDALRLRLSPAPDGARRLTWDAPASWEARWPPR
jgi:tRNA threonylcarbamoyladenosine biosynthesis protein TsaE